MTILAGSKIPDFSEKAAINAGAFISDFALSQCKGK